MKKREKNKLKKTTELIQYV